MSFRTLSSSANSLSSSKNTAITNGNYKRVQVLRSECVKKCLSGRILAPAVFDQLTLGRTKAHGIMGRATSTVPESATEHSSNGAGPASIIQSMEEFQRFTEAVRSGGNVVPVCRRIFSDQLTPVVAYRCLIQDNDVNAPSFLLESVVNGDQQGRYSFVGAMPAMEVIATQGKVVVLDHEAGTRKVTTEADPMQVPEALSRTWRPVALEGLPQVFTGGWVGYAGYDTVRYVYSGKLPFSTAPQDDRGLADMHLALYNDVVVFDQATKVIYAIAWVHVSPEVSSDASLLKGVYNDGVSRVEHLVGLLTASPLPELSVGRVDIDLNKRPASPGASNMSEADFMAAIATTKEHISAGDIFQLVLSQRFERRTFADPFEIYRALRVVNPSPYMVYMQARGCILVSSSPEILARVDKDRTVTNRPLAGTRRRGSTKEEDLALEKELLADEKECAEHVMLVDLGRNDVGKVSISGSVDVEALMQVERYSHVMHISSTVTGKLLPELDAWDALRAALPAGTVSGAPKVSAMQIIDRLEVNRRGPYGGGIGHVSFTGAMDMALGLRTMIIPTSRDDTMYRYNRDQNGGKQSRKEWVVHIQAGAGVVADSVPEKEFEETVNKAAALGRAVDLAEQAFGASMMH
ncbi:hypothetical protein CEUSTIGMA_g4325.t1 [Chlamydomonas eustigma]|uniref:anthranilate synthase n=1 Tax=Chlamydomonas eustigma TaxID=1157962 RepID=A0A250X1R5_9CHLO|nr:hypothetical protein CEUSTIGMA_g4325.t1 [Chlamydomonas eustigma]|eukprot:GAX76879.1 hypothetical protein CEUSTIGMA_g4325.t1 [Chlamydomonas eustigma]